MEEGGESPSAGAGARSTGDSPAGSFPPFLKTFTAAAGGSPGARRSGVRSPGGDGGCGGRATAPLPRRGCVQCDALLCGGPVFAATARTASPPLVLLDRLVGFFLIEKKKLKSKKDLKIRYGLGSFIYVFFFFSLFPSAPFETPGSGGGGGGDARSEAPYSARQRSVVRPSPAVSCPARSSPIAAARRSHSTLCRSDSFDQI